MVLVVVDVAAANGIVVGYQLLSMTAEIAFADNPHCREHTWDDNQQQQESDGAFGEPTLGISHRHNRVFQVLDRDESGQGDEDAVD